jgi:hypothetical protein
MFGWSSAEAARAGGGPGPPDQWCLRGKDLDGDGPIEASIPRLVYFAHTPGADQAEDFVGAEPVPAAGDMENSRREYTPVQTRRLGQLTILSSPAPATCLSPPPTAA